MKNGKIDVLVTAPISKSNIQSEDFAFPGHTDYLASEFDGESGVLSNGIYEGSDPTGTFISTPIIPRLDFDNVAISVEFRLNDTVADRRAIVIGGNGFAFQGSEFGS